MKTPQEKYFNDLQYKQLVDMLHHCINQAQFTPSEIREAAMLAAIHYESMNFRRHIYSPLDPQLTAAISECEDWANSIRDEKGRY